MTERRKPRRTGYRDSEISRNVIRKYRNVLRRLAEGPGGPPKDKPPEAADTPPHPGSPPGPAGGRPRHDPSDRDPSER